MASAKFNVPSTKGQFMLWSWTTQSANAFSVTLQDSSGNYINNVSRQSTNPLPVNSGGSTVNGTGLVLTVNCPNSSNLKCLAGSNNVYDANGGIVATNFTVNAEDAGDNDYNDVSIVICFWKSKG